MAMTKCAECGKEVSDKAVTCPTCGVKIKPKTKKLTWAVVGTLAIVFIASMVGNSEKPNSTGATKTPPAPKVKTKSDIRFELANEGRKQIKQMMRDPDSLKFEYIGVNEDATVACYVYRAKNGFGGMTKESLVIYGGTKASKDTADFRKYCKQPLEDLTSIG